MNSKQAKSISIIDLLHNLNCEPTKKLNNDIWFNSPLHTEKTSSFKVDTNKNIWYDHGIGKGGNIIDFVVIYYNCNFSEALSKISSIVNNTDNSFLRVQPLKDISNYDNYDKKNVIVKNSNPDNTDKKNVGIIKVQNLQNKALINYVNSRGINTDIATKYIKEIYWINQKSNKSNFGLCFKNDTGGYEIRNSILKLNIGGKSITTIKGMDLTKVSIFEGFMDYLTALIYFKIDRFKGTVIILNSISLLDRTIPLLKDKLVYAFLDNDRAGKKALSTIKDNNINILDCSNYYKDYKDFNDLLMNES